MSRISYSKHHPAALRPQLPQHPAHGDVGNRSAVPIRHELEFSEKLLEECPAAPPDEGGNQYAIRDAISMPSLCHQYALSMPSVCHQYASPVEVSLVHAHRDGRHLPGRRRKPIVTVGEPASSDCAEAGKLQMTLLCKGEHAILRPQVDERVLDLDEWQSVTIRGHRWPSVALRGHQRPSEAISAHQWPSEAIRGHAEGTQ